MPDKFVPRSFRCVVEADGDGTAKICPAGELDMSTVPVLQTRLDEALSAGHKRLIVDLSELDFMDSMGLTLLTHWSLGAANDGFNLALVPGNGRIQRLFELTGLTEHFQFVDK